MERRKACDKDYVVRRTLCEKQGEQELEKKVSQFFCMGFSLVLLQQVSPISSTILRGSLCSHNLGTAHSTKTFSARYKSEFNSIVALADKHNLKKHSKWSLLTALIQQSLPSFPNLK
jgi:hypothetical protein